MNRKTYRYYFNFLAYFLSFMLIESYVNVRISDVISSSYVNYFYSLGLLFSAMGFILQCFKNRLIHCHTFFVSIIACISLVIFAYSDNMVMVIAFSMLCLLSVGFIGGTVHEMCSHFIYDRNSNFLLALSMSIAITIQYILQYSNIITIEILISCILLLAIDFPILEEKTIAKKESASNAKEPIFSSIIVKKALPYILLVAVMSMILGIEDSILVYKNATGELALFSFARLFYALGLICAGVVSNYKNGIYLTLFSICSMILSVISIVFMSADVSSYNICMSIMYFYCGFYVIFLTIKFMLISPAVAGFGRVSRCLATSIIVLITTLLGSSFTYIHCIILSCVLIIATLFISVFMGVLTPVTLPATNHSDLANFEDDIYTAFSEKYKLTKREQEIMIKLVDSEDTVVSIASDLNISRRVLQRHISSIYEKTNVQTRSGLIKKVYTV